MSGGVKVKTKTPPKATVSVGFAERQLVRRMAADRDMEMRDVANEAVTQLWQQHEREKSRFYAELAKKKGVSADS